MKNIFITATDTEVGKTHIGRMLVKALLNNNYSCVPRKPVESGCELREDALIPSDAMKYVSATDNKISLDEICPYRYEPPISPERAIRLANEIVTTKDLAKACELGKKSDFLVVEGAGGFYSPLCSDGLNADLAQALRAKVILVAPDRLGCINQILLNIEAINKRKLDLLAVVLNKHRPHEESAMDNLEDLRMRLKIPVIPIPFIQDADQTLLDQQYEGIEALLAILKPA